MPRFVSWVIAGLAFCAAAAAQTPNPVLEHYRAYGDALGRGDLIAAEAAAERAFSASQQRDGEGGRTAVLALNLATVRMLRQNHSGARAPAELALRLSAIAESGVDQLAAALVLGRAEIGSPEAQRQTHTAGARRLRDALGAAAERPDLIGEAYPAAVALGAWSFTDQRYGDAVEAWAIAERTAEGANGDTAFARAYANIGIAASLIMDSAGARMRPREVERAATALAAAVSVYERHVSTGSAETLTPVQNAYAQALAWRAALSAKLRSDDMNVPPEIASNAVWEIGEPVDQRPACHLELAEHPRIRYPERMQNQSGVGSVIVHLRTDDVGVVTTRRVVAAVGASFARSVDDLESDWRMRRRESSPPGCRLATSYFTTVVFMLR